MKCWEIDRRYNQRLGICRECGERHWYNIKPFRVDAYNIKYKMFKDHQRTKYAKELLQPIDSKGKRNKDFYKIYGDPEKQVNPNSKRE